MLEQAATASPDQPGNASAPQQAMDGFAQMNAGTVSPAEFLARDNVSAIMAAASGRNNR